MKKRNIITVLTFLVITFMIIGHFSCKKNDNDKETYSFVLGAIMPLDQEKGLLRRNALQVAVDEINSNGAVGKGYFIDLVIKSSEGADRKIAAANAAQQIIDNYDNVVGFVSCFSSSTEGIVNQVSIPKHYPCISGSATSNTLSGVSPYFHRLCPPDEFEAKVLSDRTNLYGINSVAIVVEDGDSYSEDLAAEFEAAYGLGVTAKIKFELNDIDYQNKINQLLAGNPEALFISMLNSNSYIEFFDTLPQVNTTFILTDGLYSTDFFKADIGQIIGEVNGHTRNFGALPSADTTNASYIYFKNAFWKKYNQNVSSYNAQFYDIGYIYAMAIEKTLLEIGINDMNAFREKINEYIRIVSHGDVGDPEVNPTQGWPSIKYACKAGGVNYTGASGNCDIDDEGNTITAYSLFKVVQSDTTYAFKTIELIP